jgi:hypothetical protein
MHINMKLLADAVEHARQSVLKTRDQEAAIAVILDAVGITKPANPWVATVNVLKDYTKRTRIPYDLFKQRQVLVDLDSRIDWLRTQLQAKYDAAYNRELSKAFANKVKAEEYFATLKARHGIEEKLSVIEAAVDKMGLMDLLGLKASDLTAAKQAEKQARVAAKAATFAPKVSMADIALEYNLSREDAKLVDMLHYLRTLAFKPVVKVKHHSKPRKKAVIDEGELKEQIALARPSLIKVYATGQILVLK